jgi:hypothetical protein
MPMILYPSELQTNFSIILNLSSQTIPRWHLELVGFIKRMYVAVQQEPSLENAIEVFASLLVRDIVSLDQNEQ